MISIVIPVYNEEDSIRPLYSSLKDVINKSISKKVEVIFINDGSRDQTSERIQAIINTDPIVKLINFRVNAGQTAAFTAGIDAARGDIIVLMDGDLQNDPSDIPRLLKKLDEGYDVVSGWRKDRKDKTWSRKIPSKIANSLISKISGVHLNDYGCSLKAYRSKLVKEVDLYGEMHRFIPIYMSWQGGKVTEIVVNHHARQFGVSKYNISRTLKVIADLIFIKYLDKYRTKPIHLFGGFGLISFFLSILCFLWMLGLKYLHTPEISFIMTPLPQLVVILFTIAIQSFFLGIIAEIVMRTHYEAQQKKTYIIDRIIENSSGN